MGQDRKEVDISQYEARLQTDWYTKTEELENDGRRPGAVYAKENDRHGAQDFDT